MEKEFVFNDLNEGVTQKLSTYYSDVKGRDLEDFLLGEREEDR